MSGSASGATQKKKVRFCIPEIPAGGGIRPSVQVAGDSTVQALKGLEIPAGGGSSASAGSPSMAEVPPTVEGSQDDESHWDLRDFNLDNASKRDNLCKKLNELESKSQPKSITLSGCNIDDDLAKQIAEVILKFPTLQKLDLSKNKIGDDGAKALAEALKNKHITPSA